MKISHRAAIWSLIIHHVWGTFLVFRDSAVSEKMFEAVCFGIFTTLGVLAGEKTIDSLAKLKWGVGNVQSNKSDTEAVLDSGDGGGSSWESHGRRFEGTGHHGEKDRGEI